MLLLKHLQKEREIDSANKRIKCTPPEDITQRSWGQLEHPPPPRIHKCLLWEGFDPLQPRALGGVSVSHLGADLTQKG